MLRFIIILFLSYLISLLVITIIANILGLTDHKITKLEPDCHPIMVPFNNSYFFEYPCTTNYEKSNQ
jgi:hypothetical protein